MDSARQPVPAGSVEIYVGNLSYDLTDDSLKELFAKYGTVASARIVLNRFNGKSKGFGFVVMPHRDEAEKAIAAYSEKEYMGRKMRVNEAKNTITE
ncbi:MAG: RNA-binding protein [Kiritimatiellae bacterium]|nr:RNA-binding protein [Kiritimatiellia bacterium]